MDCGPKEEVTKGNLCYFPSTSFIQFSLNIVKGCPDVCSLQPWFNLLTEIVKYVKPRITYSEVNTEVESYVFGPINT